MVKLSLPEALTILGLPNDVGSQSGSGLPTEEEVKKAYRKMAIKTHPDKNRNDPVSNRILYLYVDDIYVCICIWI